MAEEAHAPWTLYWATVGTLLETEFSPAGTGGYWGGGGSEEGSAPDNTGACMYEATKPAAAASKDDPVDITIVYTWARGEPRCYGLGVEPRPSNKDT